ncbi:MAG TPA: hypothetical protein PLT26_14900 [Anaerolineaceae bacterium]|jgi:hypothetical protein|nr:hypothetical protein [Anaerolineaceae bacterium]
MTDDAQLRAIRDEIAKTIAAIDEWRQQGTVELRQPGDVDAEQLAEHWHCCEQTARDRMKKLVATGERFIAVKVFDPIIKRSITIWRLVS